MIIRLKTTNYALLREKLIQIAKRTYKFKINEPPFFKKLHGYVKKVDSPSEDSTKNDTLNTVDVTANSLNGLNGFIQSNRLNRFNESNQSIELKSYTNVTIVLHHEDERDWMKKWLQFWSTEVPDWIILESSLPEYLANDWTPIKSSMISDDSDIVNIQDFQEIHKNLEIAHLKMNDNDRIHVKHNRIQADNDPVKVENHQYHKSSDETMRVQDNLKHPTLGRKQENEQVDHHESYKNVIQSVGKSNVHNINIHRAAFEFQSPTSSDSNSQGVNPGNIVENVENLENVQQTLDKDGESISKSPFTRMSDETLNNTEKTLHSREIPNFVNKRTSETNEGDLPQEEKKIVKNFIELDSTWTEEELVAPSQFDTSISTKHLTNESFPSSSWIKTRPSESSETSDVSYGSYYTFDAFKSVLDRQGNGIQHQSLTQLVKSMNPDLLHHIQHMQPLQSIQHSQPDGNIENQQHIYSKANNRDHEGSHSNKLSHVYIPRPSYLNDNVFANLSMSIIPENKNETQKDCTTRNHQLERPLSFESPKTTPNATTTGSGPFLLTPQLIFHSAVQHQQTSMQNMMQEMNTMLMQQLKRMEDENNRLRQDLETERRESERLRKEKEDAVEEAKKFMTIHLKYLEDENKRLIETRNK